MRHKRERACRANKFLLVPRPRFIGPKSFWGAETPTRVEVVNLILEKIQVHREEIADAQDLLKQLADQDPNFARLLPQQKPALVVSKHT